MKENPKKEDHEEHTIKLRGGRGVNRYNKTFANLKLFIQITLYVEMNNYAHEHNDTICYVKTQYWRKPRQINAFLYKLFFYNVL